MSHICPSHRRDSSIIVLQDEVIGCARAKVVDFCVPSFTAIASRRQSMGLYERLKAWDESVCRLVSLFVRTCQELVFVECSTVPLKTPGQIGLRSAIFRRCAIFLTKYTFFPEQACQMELCRRSAGNIRHGNFRQPDSCTTPT
jgi:hypothetical protein